MTARITAFLATVVLCIGAGGAFALASVTSGGTTTQNAGKLDKAGKHCGDANHIGNIDRGNDPDETDCKGGAPKR